MIRKKLVKGICGLAMTGGLLLGILSPAMEAEAAWEYATVREEANSRYKYFWADVGTYNERHHCVYGYLNRTSDSKVCAMGQKSGYGLIEFSTNKHKTNRSDKLLAGHFYARVMDYEIVNTK